MRKLLLIGIVLLFILIGYLFRYPILDFLTPNGNLTDQNGSNPAGLGEPAYRFAVVLDNALPSRDFLTGISQADVVFEAPAEGSFTRYLALFQNSEVSRIGPIRSARPYFLNWTLGWDAILVHSGGSSEALKEIEENPAIKNINEFFNSQYIRRDSSKPAPHNLFTSTKLLTEKAQSKGWDRQPATYGWPVKADAPTTATPTAEIVINFGNPAFNVSYEYDAGSNTYRRFLAEDSHRDSLTGEQLMIKNLVIIETSSRVIDPNLLTIDLRSEGSGRAIIFQDGEVTRARWRKTGEDSPLEFLEADDSLVAMNDGLVWITVMDQTGSFAWQ